MTVETSSSQKTDNGLDSDAHDQEVKKSYYHTFDDATVAKMKKYYKMEDDTRFLLKYIKDHKVPDTTPNDV